MADESHPANDGEKKAALERRLANLRPIQKGEIRNPDGTNGWRKRQELIATILDEPDDEDDALAKGESRIRNVVLAMGKQAKKGDAGAGKLLVEHYAGKAKQQVELSGEVKTGHVLVIPMPGAGTDEDMERVAAEAQDKLKAEVAK